MTHGRQVWVKRFPERSEGTQYEEFLRELDTCLESDRPSLVLDFSGVSYLDSSGIETLLVCMEEVMKRNGDLKLACVSDPLASILEITRADRLFEIFENCSDAVESFHQFSARAFDPLIQRRAQPSVQNTTNAHKSELTRS
jgi:anti-sigma B factor antagonist